MTETEKGLVARLVEVKNKVGAVSKAERTESGAKFNFRGVDAVVNAVAGELIDQGIVVVPRALSVSSEYVVYGGNNAKGFRTQVEVEFTYVYGEERLSGSAFAEAIDSGDKSTAKAMSVAYRTFLLQSLTLPTDERDPDHDQYDVNGTGGGEKEQGGAPEVEWTPLQISVMENSKFANMEREDKKQFISRTMGKEVASLHDLNDEDCSKILAELKK